MQTCLLQYMQLFQTLYKRGTEQAHSTKTVQGQVCQPAIVYLNGLEQHHVALNSCMLDCSHPPHWRRREANPTLVGCCLLDDI